MINEQKDLKLELKVGIEKIAVFNFKRFRYIAVPSISKLNSATLANRDAQVLRWLNYFVNEHEYADTTKWGYIHDFIKFVRVCDEHSLAPESKNAIIVWERHLVESVRLGLMNINSARKLISSIKTIISNLRNDSDEWFSKYSLFRSEVNPVQGYSDQELAKLIKVIYQFFKQVCPQLISNKDKKKKLTYDDTIFFKFKGKTYKVRSATTKCFSAAYFLISYFTFANCYTILRMKKQSSTENGKEETWFEQSVLKPRANKYVSVSIGDNGTFNVPKYSLSFFKNLLNLSNSTTSHNNLLFCVNRKGISSLEFNHVQSFAGWLQSTFELFDDNGKPLKALSSKFRASGSYRYLSLTGSEVDTSTLLGNTPQVIRRHYSTGNENENNKQLYATAVTLESVVKCSDIELAKQKAKDILEVEVLPYETFLNKYNSTQPQKTVIGTGCKSPFDVEAKKYRKKMNFSPQMLNVEHLACSDIVNCFFCQNQVIIESIEDIWCLLSFRECILDSREMHRNRSQFDKNFDELLDRVNLVLFSISPSVKRKSERKLSDYGRHPLWPSEFNIEF